MQHSCWLFPLKAAGGERMRKTPLVFEVFEAFAIHCLILPLPLFLSLALPLSLSLFPSMLFIACTNAGKDGPDRSAWNLCAPEPSRSGLCADTPLPFPPNELISLFLTPQRIHINVYLSRFVQIAWTASPPAVRITWLTVHHILQDPAEDTRHETFHYPPAGWPLPRLNQ